MPSSVDVAMKAVEFVDVPFVYQGRSRNGTDCVGLPAQVLQSLGIRVRDYTGYPRRFSDIDFLLGFVEEHAKKVHDGTGGYIVVNPGQLLVFHIRGILPHLGIVDDQEWFIHAYQSVGKVARTRFALSWQEEVHSVWEWNGVSYV